MAFLDPLIGIVGVGDIGIGLAQTCVQAGFPVLLLGDTDEELGTAENRILRALQRSEQPAAFGLLRKAVRLQRIEDCDIVVECSTDNPAHAQDMLRRVDAHMGRGKILAAQTSATPVALLGRAVENPNRLVGVHFMAPVVHMKMAEVIRYEHAERASVDAMIDFVHRIGKTPVACKDAPGFIMNRLARPFIHTALSFIEKGRGTPLFVDGSLRSLGGFPAGPVEMVDFFGLGEDFGVAETIYQLLGRPERLLPSALVYAMIGRGIRGRRSGGGFYLYNGAPPGTCNPVLKELVSGYDRSPARPEEILSAVLEAVFAEAHRIVDDGIAGPEDVDAAAKMGLLWPKGPFEWEKEKRR